MFLPRRVLISFFVGAAWLIVGCNADNWFVGIWEKIKNFFKSGEATRVLLTCVVNDAQQVIDTAGTIIEHVDDCIDAFNTPEPLAIEGHASDFVGATSDHGVFVFDTGNEQTISTLVSCIDPNAVVEVAFEAQQSADTIRTVTRGFSRRNLLMYIVVCLTQDLIMDGGSSEGDDDDDGGCFARDTLVCRVQRGYNGHVEKAFNDCFAKKDVTKQDRPDAFLVPMDDLQTGDLVLSQNKHNGKLMTDQVLMIQHRGSTEPSHRLWNIEFSDGGLISVTRDHLLILENGSYVAANEVQEGTALVGGKRVVSAGPDDARRSIVNPVTRSGTVLALSGGHKGSGDPLLVTTVVQSVCAEPFLDSRYRLTLAGWVGAWLPTQTQSFYEQAVEPLFRWMRPVIYTKNSPLPGSRPGRPWLSSSATVAIEIALAALDLFLVLSFLLYLLLWLHGHLSAVVFALVLGAWWIRFRHSGSVSTQKREKRGNRLIHARTCRCCYLGSVVQEELSKQPLSKLWDEMNKWVVRTYQQEAVEPSQNRCQHRCINRKEQVDE